MQLYSNQPASFSFKTLMRVATSPAHIGTKTFKEIAFGEGQQVHPSSINYARRRVAVVLQEKVGTTIAKLTDRVVETSFHVSRILCGNRTGGVTAPANGCAEAPSVLCFNLRFDGTPHPVMVKKQVMISASPVDTASWSDCGVGGLIKATVRAKGASVSH